MGVKQIWDGEQLPPVGCDVLIHLASVDRWVAHRVTGYDIKPSLNGDKAYHRIFIQVRGSADGVNVENSRLLCDVRPVDWLG